MSFTITYHPSKQHRQFRVRFHTPHGQPKLAPWSLSKDGAGVPVRYANTKLASIVRSEVRAKGETMGSTTVCL